MAARSTSRSPPRRSTGIMRSTKRSGRGCSTTERSDTFRENGVATEGNALDAAFPLPEQRRHPRMPARVGLHEEASVKTKSKTITGLPRHPFGIIRVAERHERICGCSHSHQRRRNAPCRTPGCNLSPALDLDVDPVEPCSRYLLAD